MTYDEEIILEATEAYEKNLSAGCYVGDLLRIIKSQKAEIERLRKETKMTIDSIRKLAVESIESAKTEAYMEFAERLKDMSEDYTRGKPYVLCEDIDWLLERMC